MANEILCRKIQNNKAQGTLKSLVKPCNIQE